jgi:hypothetical protein
MEGIPDRSYQSDTLRVRDALRHWGRSEDSLPPVFRCHQNARHLAAKRLNDGEAKRVVTDAAAIERRFREQVPRTMDPHEKILYRSYAGLRTGRSKAASLTTGCLDRFLYSRASAAAMKIQMTVNARFMAANVDSTKPSMVPR